MEEEEKNNAEITGLRWNIHIGKTGRRITDHPEVRRSSTGINTRIWATVTNIEQRQRNTSETRDRVITPGLVVVGPHIKGNRLLNIEVVVKIFQTTNLAATFE